jgi:hypothetical protein
MDDDEDPIVSEYTRGFGKPDKAAGTAAGGAAASGGAKHRPFTVVGDTRELVFRSARLPDPTTIPPRPWLYGTHILRGYVSVLVAPGGVGKTGYAMGVALSLAIGRALFADKVFQRVNVAVLNLEDPLDELERRLAALMICHRVDRAEVQDRYFLYSSDDRRLTIAALSDDGYEIVHPDEQAIIREIQAHTIGVLFVDPFAESHELEENSNPQMIKAAAAWRRIARATGCAIFLLHHVRKGAAADIDAARGAKALTDSARVGLILSAMTEDEANEFDVAPENRWSYVRLDDAKSNMAAKAGAAKWFELHSIELGNGTAAYPNGDRVAAIAPWKPPSAMGDLTVFQCNQALDVIDEGPREGVRYTHNRSGKSTRWAGQVLIDLFAVGEKRAAAVLATWLKAGVLEIRKYDDAEQRKSLFGLFVVALHRPGMVVR